MEKIGFRDRQLSVWTKGKGNSILFVHGFPFDHAMWLSVAERLTDKFRVIVPDLRRFGESFDERNDKNSDNKKNGVNERSGEESHAPRAITSMADFADDLADLLEAMKIEKTVICGLSMGGYIGMEFLRRHSDRLAGLILCDTKTVSDSPEAAAGRRKLAQTIFLTGTEPLPDRMIPNLLSKTTVVKSPETVSFLREMILRQRPEGIAAAALGMAERSDTTPLLAICPVPLLTIGGQDDVLSPPDVLKEIAAAAPDGRFVEIADAGHLSPLEKPAEFAAAVAAFLRDGRLFF